MPARNRWINWITRDAAALQQRLPWEREVALPGTLAQTAVRELRAAAR